MNWPSSLPKTITTWCWSRATGPDWRRSRTSYSASSGSRSGRLPSISLSRPLRSRCLDNCKVQDVAVDILVNNAGYGRYGEFAEVPREEDLGQIRLNVTALTELTRLCLGPMLERRSGRIMNVASTAGFQPGPLMAVYYATKAYVISFSEAIANELADKGITVTCLCPGATETAFAGRAGNDATRLFKNLRPMDAKTVARAGYRGLLKGKTLVIPGFPKLAGGGIRP